MTTSPGPDAQARSDRSRSNPSRSDPSRSDLPGAGNVLLDEPFAEPDLVSLRRSVAAHADRTGLAAGRVNDLVLIAYELATNAVRHGGGTGRLRLWVADGSVHCEVTDHGPGLPDQHRGEPDRPGLGATGGRGLWIALTFSDRLELSNSADGATVTATLDLP